MKKLLAIILALLCCATCVACEREQGEKIDPTKTQIYIGLYNGGLGEEFIDQLKVKFEEQYPEYQIIKDPSKDNYDAYAIMNSINSYRQDIFFIDYMTIDALNAFRNRGIAADITDIVINQNVPGENKTIKDKMNDSLKGYYCMNDECYAIPWYQASYQAIYDKALFAEKELYKDSDGEWNDGTDKHFGIDGVEGNFDDGLPRTVSEYKELITRMKSRDVSITPFSFYGRGDYYFNSYMASIYADYEGLEDYMITLNGEGTDSHSGKTYNLDNYYELKGEQEGKQFAAELGYFIANDSSNYTAGTFSTSQLHTTAQREYLLSIETNKPVGMIIEGCWWENEAKDVMTQMAKKFHNPDYAYGTREFGVMPIPKADEDSDYTVSEGRTICCNTTSCVVVNGTHTPERIANAKKFLQFAYSNLGLEIQIAYTNVSVPYSVQMSQEYEDMLTPYAKEMQNIYDTSTVVFESVPNCDFLKNEGNVYISYLSLFSAAGMESPISLNFLPDRKTTVAEYISALKNAITVTEYNAALNKYKARIAG